MPGNLSQHRLWRNFFVAACSRPQGNLGGRSLAPPVGLRRRKEEKGRRAGLLLCTAALLFPWGNHSTSELWETRERIYNLNSRCGSSQDHPVSAKGSKMNVLLNNELVALLNSRRLPARLNLNQAAAVLGFSPHDLPVLTSKKLLRPLGRPTANCTKYYAAREIESLGNDTVWLGKATQTLSDHWRMKNSMRRNSEQIRPSPQNHPVQAFQISAAQSSTT